MSTLWNRISRQLWKALPEGARSEILQEVHGFVTQGGALSVRSSNRLALLSLEQDYGALVENYAGDLGFEGPVTYRLTPTAVGEERVREERPRVVAVAGQLSFFDTPDRVVDARVRAPGERAAALRVAASTEHTEFATSSHDVPQAVAMEARWQPSDSDVAVQVIDTPDLAVAAREAGLGDERGLDSWIAGDENPFVYGAARAMAAGDKALGQMLFVHGAAGMGKTHLLQAIGYEALCHRPQLRVRYMRAETFVNKYIEAIAQRQTSAFRRWAREDIDLLLVDDVDFFARKTNSQSEFRHTLHALLGADKCVVMTSCMRRDDLRDFDDRLRNRLMTGLSVSIDAPGEAGRREICRREAAMQGISVPADVLDVVASTVRTGPRELLAHFTRILSYARFTGRTLSADIAIRQLAQAYCERTVSIRIEDIVDRTVQFYGLAAADIIGRGRTRRVVTPRKVAMYLGRKLTDMSYPELGRYFDGRDHTTILDAYTRIEAAIKEDRGLRAEVDMIRRRLANAHGDGGTYIA